MADEMNHTAESGGMQDDLHTTSETPPEQSTTERYYVTFEWLGFWWAKDACEVTVPSVLHVYQAVRAEAKRRYPVLNGLRIKRVEAVQS